MAIVASCVSLASVRNISLSVVTSHGDGGRQVARLFASANPLWEAIHLKAFPDFCRSFSISMAAKVVMRGFNTDHDLGFDIDAPHGSEKDSFSFDIGASLNFDNDQSFNKNNGARFDSSQSFNSNQGFGLNQRERMESQATKLFVGNLPWSANEQRLEDIFKEAGTVELVEVITDKMTGRSRGFAFVTMGSAEEAEAAVSKLDGYVFGGRAIKVNHSSRQTAGGSARSMGGFASGDSNEFASPEIDELSQVFVGNLAWGVDDVALENMFISYGEVLEARIVYDRDTGRSRGFGFVTLSSPSEASAAISRLNGSNNDGRPLRVNLAGDRPGPRF
ncbi:hypothetical protein O6H91_17G078400 [Diphasiastrum complanatum]|uniref:Uncharacterized protein n=2 Tax=Diphasiastrum complanatum TaxID=34168 RepID=A0ACC2B8G2_DIPCM|nr:hypothetical protein O6H91_17G078400 [Diphasiastrum complanatum]KAJ7526029.1 hypothetical protein O6H91_17G078400 [Diphasiastrum complanatum]